MLLQTHQVFKFYFPKEYTEEVRFAFDEIFTYSTQLMTGRDLKTLDPLQNVEFLSSLRICINCEIGKEYLFRYLSQRYCDEMVIFLHLLSKYKAASNNQTRLLIAKDITKICIDPQGVFAIKISYECRQKILM